MADKVKEYLRFSAIGAGFGITTYLLSGLSNALVSVPMGFSSLGIKNAIKVSTISGGTAAALLASEEKFDLLTKIDKLMG